MEAHVLKRELCVQLGHSLEYPDHQTWDTLVVAANQIGPVSEEASKHLQDFLAKMKRMGLEMWQEYYVQTFDLMPKCSLYLSVHLFGEESFKRAELMAGLKGVYERHAPFGATELPDHLAVILKQSALFGEEEWSELVSMCMVPALSGMIRLLEKNGNPYACILKAVQILLVRSEKVHV
ncbi:MAG: nitrate reductase molybdenum cofactor assembly chaperone [Candidatus Omnitrophica bacterium]|nr:nitrate reductase molybdenum cofactor assembly chaperone [Candidatus Omnitrophota bacterium]